MKILFNLIVIRFFNLLKTHDNGLNVGLSHFDAKITRPDLTPPIIAHFQYANINTDTFFPLFNIFIKNSLIRLFIGFSGILVYYYLRGHHPEQAYITGAGDRLW